MKVIFTAFFLLCLGIHQNNAQPTHSSISYDNRSLIINGKRTFIYSGSFHYFRCPKALWHNRFETIKAAGFNTIDTYIPWNRHEQRMPKDTSDYTAINLGEFEEWLKMAEAFGFYVIARPGPFICAEYDRGGYPGWLSTLRPEQPRRWMWYRSDDPVYLKWAAHWMKAACQVIARHQITRRTPGTGGVILMQVENEFSHVYFPEAAKITALKSLVKTALDNGINVPLIACESPEISHTTDTLIKKHVIETNNFYPYNRISSVKTKIDALRASQPNAPLMVTELQGGWFALTWSTPTFKPDSDFYIDGRTPAQAQNLTLYCIQNGESMLNFYMLFGGTNLNNTEAKDMQTSYDFGAAIRENGMTGEKYRRVKAIGSFIKAYGAELLTSVLDTTLQLSGNLQDVEVAERRTAAGARFIFIRSNNPEVPHQGTVKLTDLLSSTTFNYTLEPNGSSVLYLPAGTKDAAAGKWLPEITPRIFSAKSSSVANIRVTADTPQPVKIELWKKLNLGQTLLDAGIYDNKYVFYKAIFKLKKESLPKSDAVLATTYPWLKAGSMDKDNGMSDEITVMLKGRKLEPLSNGLPGQYHIPAGLLSQGDNELRILYQNTGYAKEFIYMEKAAGITDIRLFKQYKSVQIGNWQLSLKNIGTAVQRTQLAPDTVWKRININGTDAKGVPFLNQGIFKTTINITRQNLREQLTAIWFSQLGDMAEVWVNGRLVGRSNSRVQSRIFDMRPALVEGQNTIVVIAQDFDKYADGGIGQAALTTVPAAGLRPAGFWYASANGITSPKEKSSIADQTMLYWQPFHFTLPALKKQTWVLHLESAHNANLYLNGHAIGRYWKNGQQTDYYLPECWLKPGTKNKISLLINKTGGKQTVPTLLIKPCTAYEAGN